MKKILFFLLVLFCIPFPIFGINGLGTFASPYNGPLTSDMNWTGTVYINGDVTVDGFTLTISSGTIVVFVASGSNIIITGTGVLTASGSAASMIRFTADFNNNGIYGEPGETWGHISFQNMSTGFTSPSTINYCIIEFGQKDSSPFGVESAGGGILTTYTYLTISNSIIRNNYAGFGGGIIVYSNAYPSISNCIITNNTAGTTGGGLLIDQDPLTRVENCIIYKNTCTGGGGGGGVFVGDNSLNVTFYNCTIVSNISSLNRGNNIRFYSNNSASNPKFYNSIVWGSNNSINYAEQFPASIDFNYCAIQGYSSGYTNCINLSGNNTDPTGPNFYNVTPGSEDYQISYVSPCRDAGTSAGAPLYDILGNFRIGAYDIGAYEVQYSNWTGASNTNWSNPANWEASVDPSSGSGDIIIPYLSGASPNYPVATPAPDFTIGTGKTMILGPKAEATLGALINNGTLQLESDVTGISSLIFNSYSGNGASIQLYLTGGGGVGTYDWHYISSPVTSLPASVFSGTTLDLARYDESLITTDQNIGWVAYDGWIYLPAGHYGGTGFTTIDAGHGYNHYLSSNHTYTFSGTFNTGNVTVNLAYNSANSTPDYPNSQGFNLLGNPFPSCLDWSQISGSLNSSISQAIYFNKMGGFASWNNGVGTNGGTGTIPPMQGFFVKTYAKSTSVLLPASARLHNATQTRYKKGLEIIPLVRLKIEDKLNSDDAVVRFDDKATAGVDNAFDAYKFSKSGLSIWTSSEGVDFSINGLPFPDSVSVITVTINSTAAENLKISASEIDGLDNYTATLTDNVNNITIDLKTTPSLSFDASSGLVASRFTLKIGKVTTVTTSVPETTVSDRPFNIYSSNGSVNIQTLSDIWNGKQGGIRVLDMTGRVFTAEDNVEFSKDNLLQIPVRAATGIYIVEVRSGTLRYVGKVMMR
jgi:hypothetical protein